MGGLYRFKILSGCPSTGPLVSIETSRGVFDYSTPSIRSYLEFYGSPAAPVESVQGLGEIRSQRCRHFLVPSVVLGTRLQVLDHKIFGVPNLSPEGTSLPVSEARTPTAPLVRRPFSYICPLSDVKGLKDV